MSKSNSSMKALLPLLLWILVVIYLSLSPFDPDTIEPFPHADKLGHFVMYSIMSFLCLNSFTHKRKFKYVIALLLSISFGIMIECCQEALNGGRHFDYFDIIANIIGAFSGALLFFYKEKLS